MPKLTESQHMGIHVRNRSLSIDLLEKGQLGRIEVNTPPMPKESAALHPAAVSERGHVIDNPC